MTTRLVFLVVVLLLAPPSSWAEPAGDGNPASTAQLAEPPPAVQGSSAPATGETETPDEPAPQPATPKPPVPLAGAPRWSPPEAQPREWEWIQLTSGEWLKGELTVMRREQLEFDSDELDDLSFDWKDIEQFRSPRVHVFAFTERRVATGVGRVDATQVVVLTALGEQTFGRAELLSIVSAGSREQDLWSGKISAGATVRSGNTNQADAVISVSLKRRTAFTRLFLDYRGNFGKTNGQQNVNNQRFDGRIDRYLYKRIFITPATIEVFSDEFQNIAYRISPGAGLGYEIFNKSAIDWTVGIDVLFRHTQFRSVTAGSNDVEQDGALRLSTNWEIELTSRVDFDGSYSVTIGVPDPANTNQSATLTLSVEMTKVLDLDVTGVWDYVGQPTANDQGVVPQKNDLKLAVELAIDF